MLDTTTSTVQYRGGGGESAFPIPFPFQETSHIHAHVTDGAPVGDSGNTARTLIAGVDFTVTGSEFVLHGALPGDSVLTIRRLLPLTQEIFFHNQGPNSPRAIEEAVDKLTMISQQLLAEIEGDGTGRIEALEIALGGKAPLAHGHTLGDTPGLADALAAKADAAATTQALAKKADAALTNQALAAKADTDSVNQSLAAKADRAELALKADIAALNAKADAAALAGKADIGHTHEMPGAVDLTEIREGLAALARTDETLLGALGGKTNTADFLNAKAALESDLAALSGRISAAAGEADATAAAVDALTPRMTAAETGLSLFDTALDTLGGRMNTADAAVGALDAAVAAILPRVGAAETGLQETDANARAALAGTADLDERLDNLGPLALAADAPVDGRLYLRQDGAWVEAPEPPETPPPSGGGGGGGTFVGDIRLLPFRPDALPAGWHFCNGAAVALSSPQGQALSALPESYRADWGIVVAGDTITLPNLFDPQTGSGLFPRAVDGAARLPGSTQTDAIRNITGRYEWSFTTGIVLGPTPTNLSQSVLMGAFTTQANPSKSTSAALASYGGRQVSDLMFDASRVVPTAEENRPVNIGMTPAVHLGV